MANIPPNLQAAILAVLREAREAGVGKVSRTTLFKLVYLLDCMHAENHEGKIASGAGWYFHTFGPYAVDLAGGIDELASRGVIQSAAGEFGDKEFTLYWLGEYPVGPSLADVGLMGAAISRFASIVRKYSHDLSKLLDYTYFQTLPMRDATPGKRIDFGALAGQGEGIAHRHTHVRDHVKIMKLLQVSERLAQKFSAGAGNERALAAHRPIYDRAFAESMAIMDREDLGDASIYFDASLV
jgi:hypothetical protein